jgi:simple sugar transport system ATP-binding protein
MIDRERARQRLEKLAGQYGLAVNWERPVEQLAVGEQQRIEILKLLYREAEILILDEPTAVLTPQETNALFQNLRRLRDEGKTVLLVTHKLREVMAITERVTVFREGRVTGEVETRGTSPEELAFLMIGRKVVLTPEARSALGDEPAGAQIGTVGSTQGKTFRPAERPALEVTGLALTVKDGSRHRLRDVSFSVSEGEIVGVAGVEGNGQTELLQALLHPRDPLCRTFGSVRMLGQDVTKWAAARIRGLGVAVIPEDRLREGIMVEQSVTENFLLGLQRNIRFRQGVLLDSAALETATAKAIQDYDVRPRNPGLPAGKLSGGNQQKLIVAREFEREPKLLMAAQPTRGVDVGAIEFIHQQIIRARDAGAGVLLVSSELDEILALSDRVLVMYEGRITAEFSRGQISERELGLKMGGV